MIDFREPPICEQPWKGFYGFIFERNELFWSHHTQGILKKYAPLFQVCCSVFPRNLPKDLLNHAGEMFVAFIFDICNVYEIAAYDYVYSQYWGWIKVLDMTLKFLGKINDWSLFSIC